MHTFLSQPDSAADVSITQAEHQPPQLGGFISLKHILGGSAPPQEVTVHVRDVTLQHPLGLNLVLTCRDLCFSKSFCSGIITVTIVIFG